MSAVEFAFIVPFFVLIVLGAMDFGRFVWTESTLQHAAREGTRNALVRTGQPEAVAAPAIIALVRSRATGLNADRLAVDVSWTPGNRSGGTVTVRVDYPFDFLISGFLPLQPLRLQGSSSMALS